MQQYIGCCPFDTHWTLYLVKKNSHMLNKEHLLCPPSIEPGHSLVSRVVMAHLALTHVRARYYFVWLLGECTGYNLKWLLGSMTCRFGSTVNCFIDVRTCRESCSSQFYRNGNSIFETSLQLRVSTTMLVWASVATTRKANQCGTFARMFVCLMWRWVVF